MCKSALTQRLAGRGGASSKRFADLTVACVTARSPARDVVTMNDKRKSCLVCYLSHYLELEDLDHQLIAGLEKDERSVSARSRVVSQGDPARMLFVIKSGWLYQETDLADGRRHLVRTLLPGDVYGLGELGNRVASTHLTACTDAVLCPFPKSALSEILQRSPRLSALLLDLSARDQVLYVDRLRAASRMSAKARVLSLVLCLLDRLRVTGEGRDDALELPLNQTEIGDLLGLTNVSVSKAMVELEQGGMIERHRTRLSLLDMARAAASVEHVDRYSELDTSWFPALAG